MNRTFLAAAILALSSAASAAIEHRRVTVEGTNDDYTPSGLTLKKGDFVLVSATGMVQTAPGQGQVGPDGAGGICGTAADPTLNPRAKRHGCKVSGTSLSPAEEVVEDSDGALMLKIGTGGAMKAGAKATFQAERDGELKFKVRDTKYADNKGSYTVHVFRVPMADVVASKILSVKVEAANDEWTATELTVARGDMLLFIGAVGKITAAGAHVTGGPDGVKCQSFPYNRDPGPVKEAFLCPMNFDDDGALMMKIGTTGVARVGAPNFFMPQVAGPVKFKVRLQKYGGAAGFYSLGFAKIPAAALAGGTAAPPPPPAKQAGASAKR